MNKKMIIPILGVAIVVGVGVLATSGSQATTAAKAQPTKVQPISKVETKPVKTTTVAEKDCCESCCP